MFLAGINYIKQQLTRCQLCLNESVTRYRTRSLMIQADRPMCTESRAVLWSPENTTRVILAKTGSYRPTPYPQKKITVHCRC